jgi:hypothetical protein
MYIDDKPEIPIVIKTLKILDGVTCLGKSRIDDYPMYKLESAEAFFALGLKTEECQLITLVDMADRNPDYDKVQEYLKNNIKL